MPSFTIHQKSNNKNYPILTKTIGKDKTFIIVEVGSTHCGSIETAKRLIDVVKISGADCVKFQKRNTKALLTKAGRERVYISPHAMAPTYGEHRDIMEFSLEEFIILRDYSINQGLFFSASGWDIPSVDFLDDLGVSFFKIASADLTNIPLLEHIASKNKPVILSTGMGNMKDVERAVTIFKKSNIDVALLQCTSSYPTPPDDIHLNVITTYIDKFPDTVIGFSGHEEGIHIPMAAVALGARVIEKHLTMNKNAVGTDHAAALNPSELGNMVTGIRQIERAMGSKIKKIQESEIKCIPKLTKSLTSTCDIKEGTIITKDMLTTKSPGTGISPIMFYKICGKKALVTIPCDVTIEENMIGN